MSATAASSAAMPPSLSRSAILLDRRIGRSTPDSEALASSDEEHDPGQMTNSVLSNFSTHSNPVPSTTSMHNTLPKPTRRPSWLSEIQPNHPRRLSNAAGTLGQAASTQPPATSPANNDGTTQSPSPLATNHTSFPFSIPLQPTLKPHRSASYSVGQRDGPAPHENTAFSPAAGSGGSVRAVRPGNISLTRRASRLPTLPDLTEDRRDSTDLSPSLQQSSSLGDEQQSPSSTSSSTFQNLHNSKSNTTLRRQVTVANADRRHRGPLTGPSSTTAASYSPQSISRSSSDLSDMDHFRFTQTGSAARRFSEHAAPQFTATTSAADWPSFVTSDSLGRFGEDTARRHSMAGLQLFRDRSNSIATATDEESDFVPNSLSRSVTHEGVVQRRMSTLRIENDFDEYHDLDRSSGTLGMDSSLSSAIANEHDDELKHSAQLSNIPSYFRGPGQWDHTARTISSENIHSNPYAVPATIKSPAHILYIVIFKCSRADVFYVPENVGLDLAMGDCVIVDGDRGFDLGMVTHCNISLEEAKHLLKEAAVANYRWLTMFSEHERRRRDSQKPAGNAFTAPTFATLADAKPAFPGAVGGIGAVGPQQGPPSPTNPSVVQRQNINPKPIRRKAEAHEIQVLKDKEAGEAKAKRVCQAKAVELGLQMEILDAEFQIDFRRLTFYYYAQSYVNFNSLVGELFKIYKTRIWMSAVNPESFQQAPAQSSFGLTPGAVRPRRQGGRMNDIVPAGLHGIPPAGPAAAASPPAIADQATSPFQVAAQNFNSYGNGLPHMMQQAPAAYGYGGATLPTQMNYAQQMPRRGSNESAPTSTTSASYPYYAQPQIQNSMQPAAPTFGQAPTQTQLQPVPAMASYQMPSYGAMSGNGFYGGYGIQAQNPRSNAYLNSPVHHGVGNNGVMRQASPAQYANGHMLEALQGLSLEGRR